MNMENKRSYSIGSASVGSGIRSNFVWWHWDDEAFNREEGFNSFGLACVIFGEIQGEGAASWLRVWDECGTSFDLVQGLGSRTGIRSVDGWF